MEPLGTVRTVSAPRAAVTACCASFTAFVAAGVLPPWRDCRLLASALLAATTGERGETLLWMIADDNFNPLQRNLLLLFELAK